MVIPKRRQGIDVFSGYCLLPNGKFSFSVTSQSRGVRTQENPKVDLTDNCCRAYALQKHRPLTLHATISLPTTEYEGSSRSITGFIYLVKLYRPFDDQFIGLWNKKRVDGSVTWIIQLQEQLRCALPEHLDTTESQAADLRTSQQWLRTVVWQLSMANGYLSSTSTAASMTFQYPMEIAKDLVSDTSRLSKQSMEVHGIGLVSLTKKAYSSTNILTVH